MAKKQEQLNLVFDNVADVIFVLDVVDDANFIFSAVNRRFLETTGLSQEAILGKSVYEVIPPPAHALVTGKYLEAIRGRKTVSWEETSDYPAGTKIGRVSVSPIFDGNGRCTQLIGTVHDITQYRRMHDQLLKVEERWRLALEGSGAGVWDWDIKADTVNHSQQWKKLLGLDDEEIGLGLGEWKDRLHPDDQPRVWAETQEAFARRRTAIQSEHRLLHHQGYWIWVSGHGMITYDAQGNPERMIGTIVDITLQKEAERAMQLASIVYRQSSEAMAITNEAGVVLTVNDAFARSRKLNADAIVGRPLIEFFDEEHGSDAHEKIQQSLSREGHWHGELWHRDPQRGEVAELCTIDTIRNADGSAFSRIYLFLDITERKRSEQVIWRQANFDALTDLPNRNMLGDRLVQLIEAAGARGTAVSLMLIDLDRFKEVNDGLGHSVGDQLLVQATQRLRSAVRAIDLTARLGGDEFAVVLSDGNDSRTVERMAEAINDALSIPYDVEGNRIHVSGSIGIAQYPGDASSAEELIKHADQAMYAAKSLGGNRHCHFLPTMEERIVARRRMVNDLHAALSSDQFFLNYQPIVNLKDGTVSKVEALLRWKHPEQGLISPAHFIPLAEDIGVIGPISNWVAREAISRFAPRCRAEPQQFEVAINVSPVQFRRGTRAIGTLLETIEEFGIPYSSIVVELTEGMLLNLDDTMKKKFAMLQEKGVKLALDDFGTGYSSLSYITKLRFDYLKIDRLFVHELGTDPTRLALCETMVWMAHKLGMKVVAEGIENEVQSRILTDLGADFGQGFLFARPMSFDDASQHIDATNKKAECRASPIALAGQRTASRFRT
ncbi:sensor domain-containing protein [Noviherbaspirillum humi]|uniref:sensor domain-containing protein n=1 Tax=Noviherbaspirillum humi TaxID=1688639 RepID=UPI001160652A|nr:EAL domain-containing protein [Noviherbaspirillum humi]